MVDGNFIEGLLVFLKFWVVCRYAFLHACFSTVYLDCFGLASNIQYVCNWNFTQGN
jgi:hypothetical protein